MRFLAINEKVGTPAINFQQNEAAQRSRQKKQNELKACKEELARVRGELQLMTERVKILEFERDLRF